MATNLEFLRPRPDSIDEYNRREEAIERSGRYKRQQAELFELDELWPECGNCGEHAEPVFGASHDEATGYHSDEQACVVCIGRFSQ